jgi:YVTN family beta-propeller protein
MKLRALILALLLSASITTPTRADVLTSDTTMVLVKTINGTITPKSVRASSDGTVSAHNMMYRHSVTLYDANTMELKATIPDKVDLNALGFPQYSGAYKGAPVEGAYSPDGKYIYVTNYAMYGKGFNHEGHDDCKATNPYDRSFLYRINRESNTIDAAYLVGKVPKVVQVSPDNKWILVSNWCSYDLSVISVESQKVVKTIKIGAYPRGIVIKKDSSLAYVAQMGGTTIHEINLASFAHRTLIINLRI